MLIASLVRAQAAALVILVPLSAAAAVGRYNVEVIPFDGPRVINNQGQIIGPLGLEGEFGLTYTIHLRESDGALKALSTSGPIPAVAAHGEKAVVWTVPDPELAPGPTYHYDLSTQHLTLVSTDQFLATDVDGHGNVVGSRLTASGLYEAVTWNAERGFSPIAGAHLAGTLNVSTNDRGQILISSYERTQLYTPDEGLRDLDGLVWASELNERGDFFAIKDGTQHLDKKSYVFHQGGEQVDLGELTWISALNDNGVLIGMRDSWSSGHFIYDELGFHDLSTLVPQGSSFGLLRDINDRNQILVDSGDWINGSYLLKPVPGSATSVPEPSALLLLAAGGLVACAARRKASAEV